MLCGGVDPLYVIAPYFNFCGFGRRGQLFVEFINKIKKNTNVRIVIVECRGKAPLPRMGVWKHFKVDTGSALWIKENLINIGVSFLPQNWKYMAWVDADITFLNENWVEDTIDSLSLVDVVQMFQTVINLGPHGEPIKTDKSFGYMHKGSGTPYVKSDKYGFWHPGYSWACTKKAYTQMGGLIDWAILGSADRHMALAFLGKVLDSCPGNIHENYKNLLVEFQSKIKGLKLSWVPGTIVHHWHGSLVNRKYKERWNILTSAKFNPLMDIGFTSEGLVQISHEGRRLKQPIMDYFIDRSEDS
jgi:hypothetical protein